jgi:hypothetical protein
VDELCIHTPATVLSKIFRIDVQKPIHHHAHFSAMRFGEKHTVLGMRRNAT